MRCRREPCCACHRCFRSAYPKQALVGLPFGVSEIRSGRAIPLLNVISMAEATGQTIAIAEAVGKDIDVRTEVPKTIRGECHRLADWRLPRHLRANVAVCFLIGELLSPRLADGNRSADAVAGRGGGAAVSRLGV